MIRNPTLRGRVAGLGLLAIAGWLLLLTVVLNVLIAARLSAQAHAAVRERAEAVAATVVLTSSGGATVGENTSDGILDSGIWVYSGLKAIDRPPQHPGLQALADSMAGRGVQWLDDGDGHRLYSYPLTVRSRQVATVVAAIDLSPYVHSRFVALWGSTALALAGLVGAYPVLRVTAARALQPVEAMAVQAADWSAHAIGQRFGGGQRFLEMRTLAARLDDVLDHLSAVVGHERQVSAELSHELRTPVARLLMEVDLLMSRPRSQSRTRIAHVQIRDSAVALQRIIDTLMLASTQPAGEAPGRCDVALALDNVLAQTNSPVVVRNGIRTGRLTAGVDAAVLERILAPIVDNALRFAGSTVRIIGGSADGWIQIDICDDGIGVDEWCRESIFEPGFQVKSVGHQGVGLGLALSRRLARGCGGDVRSIPTPEGATFRVRLPHG